MTKETALYAADVIGSKAVNKQINKLIDEDLIKVEDNDRTEELMEPTFTSKINEASNAVKEMIQKADTLAGTIELLIKARDTLRLTLENLMLATRHAAEIRKRADPKRHSWYMARSDWRDYVDSDILRAYEHAEKLLNLLDKEG